MNKNNRYVIMRYEFAWHSKLSTNWLWSLNVFVVINKMIKIQSKFYGSKNLANRPNPALRNDFNKKTDECGQCQDHIFAQKKEVS